MHISQLTSPDTYTKKNLDQALVGPYETQDLFRDLNAYYNTKILYTDLSR